MKYGFFVKLGLLLVAVVAVWAHGYATGKGGERHAAVQAQNATVTRSVEASEGVRTSREEKRSQRRSDASKQKAEVDRALQDNRDWASQPVPDGVWDSLFPGR